jgi:hypothetical protein
LARPTGAFIAERAVLPILGIEDGAIFVDDGGPDHVTTEHVHVGHQFDDAEVHRPEVRMPNDFDDVDFHYARH